MELLLTQELPSGGYEGCHIALNLLFTGSSKGGLTFGTNRAMGRPGDNQIPAAEDCIEPLVDLYSLSPRLDERPS